MHTALWCPMLFPSTFLMSLVFLFRSYFSGPESVNFFCIFSLRPKYLHLFARPCLPHSRRAPGLGLALVSTDLWSQRRTRNARGTEIPIHLFATMAGV